MGNRVDAILESRTPKEAPERIDRNTRAALQRLTQQAEWPVLLEYLAARIDAESVDRQAPNTGALLLTEGRRTVVRELRSLRNRVTDDRSDGKRGSE
ncbi:hypothetical protein IWC96_14440 [Brevundimonas sp. BAL450]|uniref:hypothetical protein n=1 Tax=Brevundimonas sp. BAL450 TaxID=1708162 RepID=UPI0018C97957|nr:hypothetical protein [Brevundimonas sp. BAL450]MBG7616473.1 hypothetical protein [Brevundimonas sp. BAL450]